MFIGVELSRDICSRRRTHNSHNSAGRRYVRDTYFSMLCIVCLPHCMYVYYMFIKYQSINQLQLAHTSAGRAMWVLSWRQFWQFEG